MGRTERVQIGSGVTKTVTVENNPYRNLRIEPWAETASVTNSGGGTLSEDHVNFEFTDQQTGMVQIGLDYSSVGQDLTKWDGSLRAQGLMTQHRNMTACAVPNKPTHRTYQPCIFRGGVWGN